MHNSTTSPGANPVRGKAVEVEDTEARQLRLALDDIPFDAEAYGQWWVTDMGRWLLQHIETRIGNTLSSRFSRQYGAALDAGEICNTAFVMLANERVLAALRNATNQWAYLYRMLRNEMFAQMGTYGIAGLDMDLVSVVSEPEALGLPTNVDEAIDRTVETLTPLTPHALRVHLRNVIGYFADRGQSRLSHVHTVSATDSELTSLGLSRPQILALANVVLGARPHHGRTSILAGFLIDSEWKPDSSAPHRAALGKYHARMLRETATDTIEILADAS